MQALDPTLPEWRAPFRARLTGKDADASPVAYAWEEMTVNAAGDLVAADPGRSGTTTRNPARELTDVNVTIGSATVVWMMFRGIAAGGQVVYDFLAPSQYWTAAEYRIDGDQPEEVNPPVLTYGPSVDLRVLRTAYQPSLGRSVGLDLTADGRLYVTQASATEAGTVSTADQQIGATLCFTDGFRFPGLAITNDAGGIAGHLLSAGSGDVVLSGGRWTLAATPAAAVFTAGAIFGGIGVTQYPFDPALYPELPPWGVNHPPSHSVVEGINLSFIYPIGTPGRRITFIGGMFVAEEADP